VRAGTSDQTTARGMHELLCGVFADFTANAASGSKFFGGSFRRTWITMEPEASRVP
jgi:hypothetical protein